MGPMFYLVQLKEARCLISAVILADWPHELALAILLGKKGGRWLHPVAGGVFGWFLLGLRCEKGSVLRSGAAALERNNDGQRQALRQVLCLHRKEEEEGKEAGLRAPHREADAAGAKAKERGRAPGLRHLPGCVSLARGAKGRASRAAEEAGHRRAQGSKTQLREGLGS